ncbi:MAG: PEPxxWA-CTERM sorting domain-containing protein [Sphingomonadaceae bacterium]
MSGTLTLEDAILPGESFGSGAITALTLNLGGIVATLADIAADVAPGPVQGFGTLSADGNSFSVFDLRFGFTTPNGEGCGFICAGQIIINSPLGPNDVSNFVSVDDDGFTIGIIDSFTPQFARVAPVPEPATWAMMLGGFAAIGTSVRYRRRSSRVLFATMA